MQFKLVFQGELAPGKAQREVQEKVAALYNVPVDKLAHWFSGGVVTIKTGLDEPTARRYQNALGRAGAICVIEPDATVEMSAMPGQSANELLSKTQSHPTKAAQEQRAHMVCPKCHYEQSTSETCIQCGVMIADDHTPQYQTPTEGESSPLVFIQRGKPPWAGQNVTSSQRTEVYVGVDFVKVLHFFSVSACVLVLIALLLPLFNFSSHARITTPVTGAQILLNGLVERFSQSPEPLDKLETALCAILMVSIGVSVIGAFGVRDVPESPKGLGLLSCGTGIAAALWVGFDVGSKANIEMGPGFYLILATFIAGMIGFLSPFLCNTRNAPLQLLVCLVFGGILIALVGITLATLTPDAQRTFMWMSVGGLSVFVVILEIHFRLKKMRPERTANVEQWTDERHVFLRILFGILWLIPIYLMSNLIIGAFIGATAGASTQSFAAGKAAALAFYQKYGLVVVFFQLLVTTLLSVFGLLPGTSKFKRYT